MKTLQIPLFILVVMIYQSCGPAESSKAIPAAHAPIPVKIIPLQKEEVSQPVKTSGQFTTDDETTLSFKTGGIVEKVLVKEGQFVRKGQLLAILDLTEIQAQVKQAELALEKAKRDFTRAGNLFKDSVATLEQFQNAQTAFSVAAQQWEAAKFNLTFSEIRASADGYVLKKFVNAGQVVAPGAAIIRTNGAGNSRWIFKAGVSDKEWARVQLNDDATIEVDYAPDQAMAGKVIRKSEGADPLTGAFYLEIEVKALKELPLASGLFGTASINPSAKITAWSIPHNALLDGNGQQGFVFVTTDQATAQKIPVTILSVDNEFIRVGSGLEHASSLIVQGSAYLTDKSAITIIN